MKKKYFTYLVLLISLYSQSQDYVDIVKLTSNNTNLGNIDNDFKTSVNNLNFEVYYPNVINEKLVLLTGITAENTTLNISELSDRSNLTMTRLNLGVKYKHSEKWSGTYMILPKIASDFKNIGSNDFQFGGLAILDYQANENFKYKFGIYTSSENFGTTLTPIIGLWHRSKNEKLYINATLPVRMDINYALTSKFSLGSDFLTSVKAYNLSDDSLRYVQEESIRFAMYASFGLLDNSLLLRAKVGFDTTDYGLYNSNETVGVQVLTVPLSGDNRTRLNSEFDSGIFFGGDIIYRFDIKKN